MSGGSSVICSSGHKPAPSPGTTGMRSVYDQRPAPSAACSTSVAQTSPSYRRFQRGLARFVAATVLASFVFNEIWEMAQMSAYVETAGRSWTSTLALCTRAAVGDVGIILGIWATGALAAGDLGCVQFGAQQSLLLSSMPFTIRNCAIDTLSICMAVR